MKRTLALAVLLLGGAALLPAADDEPPGDDDAQDVVFIGDARPMFIRLHVRNGEGSAFTGYDAFFEKLYKFLDRDGSGTLSRTEAARAPSAAQINQYLTGNPYIVENRRPGAAMATPINVEDLDADRDGRVTPEELRAYYRANAGGALVVLNQTASAGSGEAMSALIFNMLDTNKDGRLSREELLGAPSELMRLDQDDDELISAFELGATPRTEGRPVVAPGMTPAPDKSEPKFGLEVIPRNDRRLTAKMDAARKVMAKYDKDKDGRLTESESGLAHELFTKLDRNRDSKLDTLEIGRWLTGKPDTEQSIRLAPTTLTNKRGERPKRAAATGNLFTMGNVQLTILSQPLTASLAFDYKSQVLSQFRTFDVDRLGYISRKQVDTQTGAFMRGIIDVADRNGDGRMMREELVEYLDLVASAALAQVSISLTSSGQGLF
jgi:Ca2+-binding EF-hand superfamily protein